MRVIFRTSSRRNRRLQTAEPRPAQPLPSLCYPLSPAPVTAVLGLALRSEQGVLSFPVWTVRQLERSKPQALAGGLAELREVASLRERGYLALESLAYPLLALTGIGEQRLNEAEHEELWRRFRLPVLEQIRGADGTLLAWECEARDGYHVSGSSLDDLRPLWRDEARCHCGQFGSRVWLDPKINCYVGDRNQ